MPPRAIEDASTSAPAAAEATEQAKWWTAAIEWDGEFKEKEVKGADVRNRLYAGKKRMFKGHKWERTADKRTWKRDMLMKHMSKRIARFKTVRGLGRTLHPRMVLTVCIDVPAQDAKPRQPCPGGIVLQASLLMYTHTPRAYSTCFYICHIGLDGVASGLAHRAWWSCCR